MATPLIVRHSAPSTYSRFSESRSTSAIGVRPRVGVPTYVLISTDTWNLARGSDLPDSSVADAPEGRQPASYCADLEEAADAISQTTKNEMAPAATAIKAAVSCDGVAASVPKMFVHASVTDVRKGSDSPVSVVHSMGYANAALTRAAPMGQVQKAHAYCANTDGDWSSLTLPILARAFARVKCH